MLDNEIIKALKWLEKLRRDTDVSEWAESIEIILDDYNRQKAEIEKKDKLIEIANKMVESLKAEVKRLKRRNDELNTLNKIAKHYYILFRDIDEVVKEMVESE